MGPDASASADVGVFRSGLEPFLRVLVQKNGSDLYLSANNPPMVRINGYCVPISSRPLTAQAPLAMLQSLPGRSAEAGLAPGQSAQWALTVPNCGRFRITAYFQRGTLALAIRNLPLSIPPLQDSALPPVLRKLAMAPSGLILLTGPNGSGKSTTAASMLDFRNSQVSGHVLTLENPIEFVFAYKKSVFNQVEIGSDSQHLHDSLQLALRHRSDVVYLSDIKDAHSMAAAMDVALSGALCIATLAAPDCEQAIERVLAFFPFAERSAIQRKLATSLKAVIAQKLLRTQQGHHHPVCEILPHSLRVAEIIRQGDLHDIGVVLQQTDAQRGQSFDMDIARLRNLDIHIAPESPHDEEHTAEVWKTSRFGLQSEFRATGQLPDIQGHPISLALNA